MLKVVLIAAAILAATASPAEARWGGRVFLDHKRVTVTQIGAISAEPCTDGGVCTLAVIQFRWGGVWQAPLHQVPCPHPRRLHVTWAYHGNLHPRAIVFACRHRFDFRLA